MCSAYAAALAVGFYDNKEEVVDNWQMGQDWMPRMEVEERAGLLRDWRKAVARSLNWVESSASNGVARKKANDDLIASLKEEEDDRVTLTLSISKKMLRGAFFLSTAAGVLAFLSKDGRFQDVIQGKFSFGDLSISVGDLSKLTMPTAITDIMPKK